MAKSTSNAGPASRADKTPNERKQAAVDFLQLVVSGKINEAYHKYVDLGGKHHNPHFRDGFLALQKAMSDNQVKYPRKQLTVKNVLGDGDLVAVHSRLLMGPGEIAVIAVHLFRFSGGKIVEMWDCGQPVPADSPNKDGAF